MISFNTNIYSHIVFEESHDIYTLNKTNEHKSINTSAYILLDE